MQPRRDASLRSGQPDRPRLPPAPREVRHVVAEGGRGRSLAAQRGCRRREEVTAAGPRSPASHRTELLTPQSVPRRSISTPQTGQAKHRAGGETASTLIPAFCGHQRQRPQEIVAAPEQLIMCRRRRPRTKANDQDRSAGVCAFSLTSRITQRDGTTGRDAPGSRTLLYPGDPAPAPAGLHRDVHGRPAACRNPGLLDDSGLASASRPRVSPGVSRHPAGSPAIPEPGPQARRRSGRPGRASTFTPCAVTLDQLHRQGRSPCGRHDGRGRQRAAAIQEDPVGGIMWVILDH